jgi:hypothetical protein
MMELIASKKFLKSLKKLHPVNKAAAIEAAGLFKESPSHPSLNFEVIKGRSGVYSILVNKSLSRN